VKLASQYPVVGQPTTIQLDAPSKEVTITYQPGAPIAKTQVLETGGQLQVQWTPERPGVASVAADGGSQNVSIKFDGTPGLGVVIFIIAGCVLFGGAAICLKALFAAPELENE